MQRQGLDVTIAGGGAEAIELLQTQRFDVVLLDLMMPVVSGRDVVDFIATQERQTPVVVCSAAAVKDTATLDENIVRVVIRKPFEIETLISAVRAIAGMEARESKNRVLIIDDDMRARYVMRAFVEPAIANEAASAAEAFAVIREQRPDLVLLDLHLPGTSGEELLRELRADPATSSIPVIIVTSRHLSEEQRDELLKNAAGVIYKGDLSRDTLGGAVRTVLGSV